MSEATQCLMPSSADLLSTSKLLTSRSFHPPDGGTTFRLSFAQHCRDMPLRWRG